MAQQAAIFLVLSALVSVSRALHPDLAASIGETPVQRRRRLKVEAILPTDPGQDGVAIGLDGKIYSDTAITDAIAQVGELGPLNPKVAVCHFPPQERAQFQVKYLEVVPTVAAQLVKKGDFLAPRYPRKRYGYGCILYDHVCDFSTEEPCNLQGTCQTNNTCFCDNDFTSCLARDQSSGCETQTGIDVNNCGTCGNVCPTGNSCCTGLCVDLATDANNCGLCGYKCTSIPGIQDATCANGQCTVSCLAPNLTPCNTASGPLCVDLTSDPNFCGTCDITCPSDTGNHGTRICNNTACGIQCNANFPTQCGDPTAGNSQCVNLRSSILNCGKCGNVCPTDPSAITICNLGQCLFSCTGGTTQCGTAANPKCVFTQSDNNNCGSCGFVCQNSFSCVSSICTNTNIGKRK